MEEDTTIAVVGIGCIFPGADNIEEFWRVLVNGEDHVQDIPPDRFNVDAFYDPNPDSPRKTYVRKAGLVKSFNEWDNKFFGISDKEAELVDPQQRFVLEAVHMALEDGGITRERLNGSETGVYIGAMNHDWDCLLRSAKQNSTNTTVTGADSSILSARVAYFYNLLGPAMTIETACSSSMVAIHTASQALRNGEISMAIAGGVSFILDPESFINLSSARMASPTGKCHTFSKDADGYARGEGCGIVILKKLADAIKDGNKIWGTIFTWLNQDGHLSSPITSPSGEQQEKLVETIYRKSNIPPSSVQYIEAHGTGTSVGDFTEVNALGAFFSKYASQKIPIGSVKTNIGHLESGAGAAALIKVLLMMEKELFVPSIHAESLNPKIAFEECKLKVCKSVGKWPENENGNRIASINCFGFGGTNSHAVIKGYHRKDNMDSQNMNTCLSLKKYVILSAEDLISLYNIAKHTIMSLQNEITLADLSSTSVHFRSHYKFRKVFVVEQMSVLVTEIEHFIKEELPVKVVGKDRPNIIFVYCGVGTTWRKMCKEFIIQDQIFKKTVQDIDCFLRSLTSVSVQSLFENEEEISDPLENHLAIFACQIALTEVWKHVGIRPDAIVGQSVGEVAAAYASGTLSLQDAVRVIYFRSLNLSKESAGKMIVIQNCPIEVIEEKCLNLKCGKANIAVYHSYHSCAVSGDKAAIEELKTGLASLNAKIIPLNVKCAYHSHLTKEASLKLEETLAGMDWKTPQKTVISTVSGRLADTTFGSPSYWAANVFRPVLFRHAIQEAKKMNPNTLFLEIGPSPVLRAHLSSIFPDSVEESLPSMKRNHEIDIFRKTFLDIFGKGIQVTWENVVLRTSNILSIPKYQFNKRKHLVKSDRLQSLLSGEESNINKMLISRLPGSSEQFNMLISHENTPFIYEHVVDGSTVVPGALYGEIGLEIGHYLLPNSEITEFDISWSIHRAFLVKDSEQTLVIKSRQESDHTIYYEAYASGNKFMLSSGKVTFNRTPPKPVLDVQRLNSLLSTESESHIVYMMLQSLGFQHGPIYQTIKKCVIRDRETICDIRISDGVMKEISRTCLHPVILDTMFQSCFGINVGNGNGQKTRILPIKVSHLVVRQRPSQSMICYTTLVRDDAMNASFNIILLQKNGSIVVEMMNFEVEKINSPDDLHSLSYHESWKPVQLQGKTFTERLVFVLSWNSEYLSLVENTFRKEHGNIDICSISLAKTSDNEFSTLQKKAESQSISVIFAPGLPGIDENTTGRWLSDTIRRTTQVFLQLLKAIYKMKSHILVVTNETQPCYSPKTCVIGAELWGMVRAVSHEGTELSFTLLDVDSLSEFSLINISRVFAGLDVGSRQVPVEYAIRGNIIYTNEITKLSESFHTRLYKKNFQKAPQPLCIRQKLEGDKSSFLAMPCSKESTNQLAICVKPTNALACTEETYFIQSNNSPELYCTDTNINGENINTCELIGFAKIGNKDTEVIACCHMELKTEMMIDKHCVFAKSGFSGYRLGDMHAVIIALSIADLVEKKSNVFIEYSEETCAIFHFLCIMLKEKKCNISNQMKTNGKKTQNTYATELVLLSADGYLEKDTLQILYPNVKQCISLSGILPMDFSMDSNCSLQFQLIDIANLYKTKQLRVASQRASRVLMAALKKKKPRNNFPLHKSSLNVAEISKDIEIRTPKEFLIRDDSAYIVVGGLTGLGWLIVKYLAQRKANKIISLSRRSPSSELEKQILNIKNLHGVEIIHKEVDITNLNSLTKVLRSVQQQMPDVPIRGVLQGAAVINDNTVPKMTKEKFEMPLIVKVLGTWNLHHLTKHMDLDVFTLHSSVASVFGNYSQTNYAAANAFLDSFAYYRRSLGLPAQVINWGALDVGMGSDPTLKDIFFHKGIGLLSARQICNALTQMFLSDQIQGIFVDFDIKRFLTSNNLKWKASKYAGLISDEEESVPKVVSESETTYESGGNMIDLIKQISAQVLMIDVSEIENTNTLAQFGVDSQNSIEIINTIYSATKVRIPILLLLSGDFTIQELANFLSNKMSDNSSEELSSGRHSSESTSMVKRYFESDQLRQSAYVFSFSIPHDINNPEFWKRVIQFLARLNPTVRVDGSELNGQSDTPQKSVDIEDFIIPFEFVQTTNELQTKLGENRDRQLSVIYEAETNTNTAHLYMTCSGMNFDAFCGKIIQKDLQKIATYIIAKNPVPAWLDKTNVDFLSLYSSKLHTVAETSKTYWQHRLRLCKTSASLKSKYPMLEHKHNEGKISLAMIDLNQHKGLLCENGWTICNIVCSAFQIALHKITTVERVPILMEVDLRSQILECQEHILSSSNHIPLVSPNFFQPGVTVRELLNGNEQIVKEGIANCLYPFPAIMELKEFDSKLHKTHSYLFDTSDIADEQYVRLASTHIEKNSTFETLLYALHNKTDQTLKLEFHFCPERVSTYTASILTESVSNFIQALSENHTKTLKQLQMQTKLVRAPMASPKASFLLVKDNGNRKKVFMEVKQGAPPLISWGPNSNSQTKMTEIMDVDIVKDNGRSGLRLWLFGRKAMTFETSEDQVCQAWVTFLKQYLPPTSFKKQEFEENENYIQSTEFEVENTYL